MKFAIIRRNGLGDFISATVPVCNYIKDKFPSSELHLFLSEQNFALAKYFFPNDSAYVIHSGNKYFEAIKTAVRYRYISPDIGISLAPSYNKLNGIFLKLLGSNSIFGIKEKGSIIDGVFAKLVNVTEEDHVALQNIKILDASISEIPPKYYPRIDKRLVKKCSVVLPPSRKIIIGLTNHRSSCQLTSDKYASVLNSISKHIEFYVIISLEKKDINKALNLQKALNMPSTIAITPALDDFVSLVNQADGFLLGDGGAAHIAGALDKPGVAIYGETSVRRWRVLSNKVEHLFNQKDVNNIDNNVIEQKLMAVLTLKNP